jgi:hypothetical protein
LNVAHARGIPEFEVKHVIEFLGQHAAKAARPMPNAPQAPQPQPQRPRPQPPQQPEPDRMAWTGRPRPRSH